MVEYSLIGLVGVLTIITVSKFASKLGIAAPLLLVLVGIGYSYIPGVPPIEIEPELILAIVLPPILYAAAVNVPLIDFRRNLKPITGLSVLLVIVTAFGSGFLLYWLLPDLSLPAAIALGAVISPPDAVAATSIGKRLGLPPQLVTVLEGEGLVNDASALVLLRSAIAATAGVVTFWGALGNFAYAVAAAIIIGFAVGQITVLIRAKLNNSVLNTAMSFVVPFLAYFPAEELKASGVLAVVVAGLVTGHQSAKHFSAQDRISERLNWRTAQFLLENGVFLLMGVELKPLIEAVQEDHLGVWQAFGLGLLVTLLLIVIRVLFVIPLIASLRNDQRQAAKRAPLLDAAFERLDQLDASDHPGKRDSSRARRFLVKRRADVDALVNEGLGWRGGAVLAWSGMRGVVTLAAAQSLPRDFPYRPQLVLIAFTVAVVTLLVQGGTLPWLIRVLGIVGTDADADRTELASLVGEIDGIALASLDNPDLAQDNGEPFDSEVIARVKRDSSSLGEAISESANDEAPGPHAQYRALRLTVLQAERAALLDARSAGTYSSRILERAQNMLDVEESRLVQHGGEH